VDNRKTFQDGQESSGKLGSRWVKLSYKGGLGLRIVRPTQR
jgi:hypothetical protein